MVDKEYLYVGNYCGNLEKEDESEDYDSFLKEELHFS